VTEPNSAPPQVTCADPLGEELVRLYQDNSAGLFRYAFLLARNREAAQDAVQEVFLRYFVERRGPRPIERPRAWLFQVLRNLLLDARKASRTRLEVDLALAGQSADARSNPETDYRFAELSRRLWELLSPRELECLRLRAEGLRYEEIAAVLDVRSGTVGALLARVQKKVRQAAVLNSGRSNMVAGTEAPYAP
jgi:RNA polymerase sigma-70 factor (ECF subfamily)